MQESHDAFPTSPTSVAACQRRISQDAAGWIMGRSNYWSRIIEGQTSGTRIHLGHKTGQDEQAELRESALSLLTSTFPSWVKIASPSLDLAQDTANQTYLLLNWSVLVAPFWGICFWFCCITCFDQNVYQNCSKTR